MSFQLQGVGVTHANGCVALAGVNLRAGQGERVALIGASGAGKSTLLNLLGTAQRPSCGQVQLLGHDVAALSARSLRSVRTRIGTVYQAAPIPARQRVVTAVLAGRLGQWPWWRSLASLVHPRDLAGAQAALARVQLSDKLFVRSDALSGGQLQRVAIARVLYQQADLVLADEPVSALDPTLAAATIGLLVQEARARAATLVASLHSVDLALSHFDRVVGLRAGRVAFDLPASQVTPSQLDALYAQAAPSGGHSAPVATVGDAVALPTHACR